jgi:hypothetical protein
MHGRHDSSVVCRLVAKKKKKKKKTRQSSRHGRAAVSSAYHVVT